MVSVSPESSLTCFRLALANIALITFVALKIPPLPFLTTYSYERLNLLHQVAGYTTIKYSFLHKIMMCVNFANKMHRKKRLLEMPQIHGITVGAALLGLLVFSVLIRKLRHEVFYTSYIFMYIVFIINVGLHQPEIASKDVIVTIFAGAMWGADRLLRAWRLFWYSYGNRATVIPLPHGGIRIVLRRTPRRAVPGTHCFLWMPEIRAFETRHFTIVGKSLSSLELVAAYDGFTNDLHEFAVKHTSVSLRASFDGPYGAVPNCAEVAHKVIFVAGGSGASFTFGVAIVMVRKVRNLSKTKIEFI